MDIKDLPGYIAFIQLQPTKLEMMEQQLKLANELINKGILTYDEVINIMKQELAPTE